MKRFFTLLVAAFAVFWASRAQAPGPVRLKGLSAEVRVLRDSLGTPHIYASNDRDAMVALGYCHARDRFFQMDLARRQASGTSAELLGVNALGSDVEYRSVGLRRTAEASIPLLSARAKSLLEGYAEGVNAWLQDGASQLPPEYATLELTKASVPAWTAVDSVAIARRVAFDLSFDIAEIELTSALAAFQETGDYFGFNGDALFFEDLFRTQPFDPAVTVPGFFDQSKPASAAARAARPSSPRIAPAAGRLAHRYMERIRRVPGLLRSSNRRLSVPGSNWWIVGPALSASGNALIANDPHLSLTAPSVFYEAHLNVGNDPESGPLNVTGVGFPGVPGIVLGCNQRICWGATTNPLDVTDVFLERLVINSSTRLPRATLFEGREEALNVITETYNVNRTGNSVVDDPARANLSAADGGATMIVPRRNGPLIAVQGEFGLSVQYTGFSPSREVEAFFVFCRAQNLEEFRAGLGAFQFGSQNWAYADVSGNIAYVSGSAQPLREDLQNLEDFDGAPPFLIRDGTHASRNEWLSGQYLPLSEFPQAVNPSQGYLVNANNDPVGLTLNNNPLERNRPGGGIYYLNYGYDGGFRAGRITSLIRERTSGGGKLTLDDMSRFQANNQMLDAEKLVPHLLAAFDNARAAGAPAALAAVAADAGVTEAVGRLREWDFSTPTGVAEGYDPGDDPFALPAPSEREVQNSVAASIYALWRSQVLANTIDATLDVLGLGDVPPYPDQSLAALRALLDGFGSGKGVGASGINFFAVDGAPSPEVARDYLLLRSLRNALSILGSWIFSSAFDQSANQTDYRWGRLHRLVFRHPLGGPFNAPPANGLSDVRAGLAGVGRAGGFQVVDASSHDPRSSSVNGFVFGGGPARRFIAELSPDGIKAWQSVPNGNALSEWLTNRYHPLLLGTPAGAAEEVFTPAPL